LAAELGVTMSPACSISTESLCALSDLRVSLSLGLSSAMANTSKPGPRFADDAGASTVTFNSLATHLLEII
jgi:hypothetical protein